MKRTFLLLLLLSLAIPGAVAAPKAITPQLGSIYPAQEGTELFLLSGNNSIFISDPTSSTSNIQVTALDPASAQLWQSTIDSGADEVAMAATLDPLGNIWIAGSSAPLTTAESVTSTAGIDNPDQVTIESATALRMDMNQLTLWKLSKTGEILASYFTSQPGIPDVRAISATNSGLSIVGTLNGKSFLLTASSSGVFAKMVVIGTGKTEINTVIRSSDGGSSLFGSSSETLSGKKVAGIRDGVLIKVNKSGAITSVVRSSAVKAARSWISADSSFLVSGPVVTGNVFETAITKFNSAFSPSWTLRVPASGASATLSANGNFYCAFTSRSTISGISGWKPTQPSLLVLIFDGRGAIKSALALPGLVSPLSLQYSKERGVVGLARASDGTVSIFTLVSR